MPRLTTPNTLLALICLASACMRVTSTPDAWPCTDSRDCEGNEICFYPRLRSSEQGQCRPPDYVEPGSSTSAGQGGRRNTGSAGSLSLSGGGGSRPIAGTQGGIFDPGSAGSLLNGGTTGEVEVPLAGAGGGNDGPTTCGGGLWPQVDYVAPYVVAGRATTVFIRGRGFKSVGPGLAVSLGGIPIDDVVADSDTQITIETPVLTDGPLYFPVTVSSEQCPSTSDAKLLLLGPPALSARTIKAPSKRERIIFEAERHMLYAVNQTDSQIERYHEVAGNWETLKPYAIPELTDIALAPNGRRLLVASSAAMSEIDLEAVKFEAKQRATSPDTFCGKSFYRLAVANDGNVLIATHLRQCSGFDSGFWYSMRDGSIMSGGPSLYEGTAAASFDGSRLYAGGWQSPFFVYNTLTNMLAAPVGDNYVGELSVSGDAARVIAGNIEVRSRSLALTGKLPADGVALASIDSTRAFVFRTDDAGAHLVVHDLNGELEAGAVYPVLKTIDLTESPSLGEDILPTIVMATTPDDSAVFISGANSILVVPVN